MSLRSRVAALAKKTAALRSRVIAHDKHHDPSKVLDKAYERAKADLANLRRQADLSLQQRAVQYAHNNISVMERGGNNRGPGVERIIRYAGGDIGEPWCVDFVIWCYGHAGSQVVKPGYPRAVSLMKTGRVVGTVTPKSGDIVRYTFDHTGIFLKDNGNGTITTIEGNTGASGAVSDGNGSDGVYEKVRSKSLVQDYLRVTA